MPDWNYQLPWYHGTQQEITVLRAGSSISQERRRSIIVINPPRHKNVRILVSQACISRVIAQQAENIQGIMLNHIIFPASRP